MSLNDEQYDESNEDSLNGLVLSEEEAFERIENSPLRKILTDDPKKYLSIAYKFVA